MEMMTEICKISNLELIFWNCPKLLESELEQGILNMKYVMVSKMWNSHFNVQQNLKIVLQIT